MCCILRFYTGGNVSTQQHEHDSLVTTYEILRIKLVVTFVFGCADTFDAEAVFGRGRGTRV